ncbi:hypothetical protein SAMN05216223_1413 [Actinacidiphila yanglinensis]|uniref:Uncharacterized protein n=1 Tax=Actinacidiphila yanglinensis TaxID=310779 RepID=A0A1H6EEI1_9ACTN|nr:hypothetical protein SAMN05216223_1413 [Actinacidiphila yanglinensis]
MMKRQIFLTEEYFYLNTTWDTDKVWRSFLLGIAPWAERHRVSLARWRDR